MKKAGKNKPSNKKKLYQNGGFKAGQSREEMQNTPGGTGGGPKRGDTMTKAASIPPKPIPTGVEGSLKTPKKKLTYAEAKKNDPKLDSYIKKRNALKAAGKTGSAEYKAVQNKINAAYGVSKRRVERDSAPMEKMASKGLPTSKSEARLQTSGSKSKSSSSGSSKSSSSSTSKSSRGAGVAAKDKSVSRALADIGIEPSKEVSFDSPSRKDRRKARRKAIREVRKSMR